MIEERKEKVVTPGQLVLRRFFRHKLAIIGAVTLSVFALFCVIGPFVNGYREYQQFFDVQTSFTAGQLQELLDDGYIPDFVRVRTVRFEGNKIKSKIMKTVLEVPSEETYPILDAIAGEIDKERDPEGLYRLYNVSFTDAEKKDMVARGLADDRDIALFARTQPSRVHLLGTDKDGQDVFTRLMYGGRVSLMIGLICVAIEILVGMSLGGVAGYFGTWVDSVIMRIVDIFNSIPTLPVVILLGGAMRAYKVNERSKLFILMAVIGMIGWPGVARLVRGQILSLREQEFMLAAKATGLRARTRIFKHLIPNVVPQLIVTATLGVGSVILFESALSFFGLGVSMPFASWGSMVNAVNDPEIMLECPFVWVSPGLAILMTVVAINFLGDGLRDAFDPKMKR